MKNIIHSTTEIKEAAARQVGNNAAKAPFQDTISFDLNLEGCVYEVEYKKHGDEWIFTSCLLKSVEQWISVNRKPQNWRNSKEFVIFIANEKPHIGHLNFDGKWMDMKTGKFFDTTTFWYPLPENPDNSVQSPTSGVWKKGNGPVQETEEYILLFDHGEYEIARADSSWFDNHRRTFSDIFYWFALPQVPTIG